MSKEIISRPGSEFLRGDWVAHWWGEAPESLKRQPITSDVSQNDSVPETGIYEVAHHLAGIEMVWKSKLDFAGLV